MFRVAERTSVVAPVAEIDSFTVARLKDEISALIAGGEKFIVVDLRRVPFADSTAIAAFIAVAKRLSSVGGRLLVAAPPSVCACFRGCWTRTSCIDLWHARRSARSLPSPLAGNRATQIASGF
jgi:anti-anti-sigma factor